MNTKKTRYLDFFNPAPFEKKAALLFELMGYEVEHNRRFADYQVEIFIKKNNS